MARRPGAVSLVEPRAKTPDEKGTATFPVVPGARAGRGAALELGPVMGGEEFPVDFPVSGRIEMGAAF